MNKKESSLLQKSYLQKSKLFLLPLTGLIKNKYFTETNTYISSPDLVCGDYPNGISFDDKILIVTYSKIYKIKQDNIYNQINNNFKNISIQETGWEKYETILMSNKRFVGFHESPDEYLYTYDLSGYTSDWSNFMKGRYSQMTEKAKQIIKNYKWSSLLPTEQKKLYCYLWPDANFDDKKNEEGNCFKFFADELGIPIQDLEEVKELCSKPNLKLETFVCSEKKQLDEVKG